MTVFQLLMLGASAFFAYKIYQHVQTLQDPEPKADNQDGEGHRSAEAFSMFDPESLIQKADIAFEEKDFEKALALLNEANAKQNNNNSDTLFKIAYILQQAGDNDEALKYYKEALELDKDNEFIHNAMASIYRSNGEFISAKMHLTASLEIDDSNPVTYYNYGNLLVDMQKNDEAIEMYEKALLIDPEFSEAKEEIEKLKEA
ncbi:tetratricopeptide repeat protein [bacterium]|nr:tetratricopeptide repeat protein [bacterium]MBU1989470.1 tetratricopeptide repeat protein [bacterium]